MAPRFEVEFLDPAVAFFETLEPKAREKILFNIRKARELNDPALFKKLTEQIWEFRTLYAGLQYRLLSFWDKRDGQNVLVIATNGFIKKTDKVPTQEIKKADQLRKAYFGQ